MIDRLNKSTSAYGRRTYFGPMNCDAENNIITQEILEKEASKCTGNILIENGVLEFCNHVDFKIEFDVIPNSWYYLMLDGRVKDEIYSDLEFGIADCKGFALPNIHTERELGFFVFEKGLDDILTVKGQDGSWYTRTYKFYSGQNDKMSFFVTATKGTVDLKDIRICPAEYAYTDTDAVSVREYNETSNYCNENDNIANVSEEFWKDIFGYGLFVKFNRGILEYSGKKLGAYYNALFAVKSRHVYTMSFRYRVIEEGNAIFGFIFEQSNRKRIKTLAMANNSSKCDWKTVSITYEIGDTVNIGFAVFDGGGKVEFSDIRIFIDGKGKEE